jgi:hypothetical protein
LTRWARQMVKRDLYRLGPDGGLPGRGHVRAARALAAAAWHPGPRGRTVHARDSSCARYGRYACRDCLPAVPAGQQRRVRARGQRPKPKRADRLRRPVGHRRTCHVRLFGAWHVVARPPRLVATVARTHRLTAEATDRSPPRHEPPFPTGRGHGAFFVPRLARLHTACGQLCGVDHRSVNMLSVTLGGMALCRRGSEPRSGIGTGRSAGRQLHGDGLNRRSGHDAPATTALVSAPRAACWAASASVMSLNCWTPKLRSAAQPDGTALPATGCCARGVHAAVPEDPEAADPLALMLLTDARRPARSGADGDLIPLAEQNRTCGVRIGVLRMIIGPGAAAAAAARGGRATRCRCGTHGDRRGLR